MSQFIEDKYNAILPEEYSHISPIPGSLIRFNDDWNTTHEKLIAKWDEIIQKMEKHLATEVVAERRMTMNLLCTVQAGFDRWAAKPHNAKWVRKLDGTPIANDIVINIFEELKAAADSGEADPDDAFDIENDPTWNDFEIPSPPKEWK